MSTILGIYNYFQVMIKSNPVFAGLFSMWGITVFGFIFRKVPKETYRWLLRRFSAVAYFNSTDYFERDNIEALDYYFTKHKPLFRSDRTLKVNKSVYYTGEIPRYSLGIGNNLFFYKRRLFIENAEREEQVGDRNVVIVNKVTLRCFSFNDQILKEFLEEISRPYRERTSGKIVIQIEQGSRELKLNRPLDSVFTENHLKEDLIAAIEDFYSRRESNKRKGFNHKFVILLHGGYGLGKTSLIQAIVSHFKGILKPLDIYSTASRIKKEIIDGERGDFFLIEDFDSLNTLKSRFKKVPTLPKLQEKPVGPDAVDVIGTGKEDSTNDQFTLGMTLSDMLNLLDGINIYDGQVIFLTTNTLDKIDPALFRRGRVDFLREVVPLEDEQTKAFISFLYDGLDTSDFPVYTKVRSADVYGFYLESLGNIEAFKNLMSIYEEPSQNKKVACLKGN